LLIMFVCVELKKINLNFRSWRCEGGKFGV
jgi:hypothetical protein